MAHVFCRAKQQGALFIYLLLYIIQLFVLIKTTAVPVRVRAQRVA
jgi:hypothetical protein